MINIVAAILTFVMAQSLMNVGFERQDGVSLSLAFLLSGLTGVNLWIALQQLKSS